MNRDETRKIRSSYVKDTLSKTDLEDQPMDLFKKWFQTALDAEIFEANAMTLATCDQQGQPSARIVLMKELQEDGFVFYTNYLSRKGQDINQNPRASLLFFWKELERQVRIEGRIEKVSQEHSKSYFHSRPRGSQLGAWASPQSKVVPDRHTLDDRLKELDDTYEGLNQLPLPTFWGGYLLVPHRFEFWQGRKNRLHDRFEYVLRNEDWVIQRLAP